jgi:hypothetical protein
MTAERTSTAHTERRGVGRPPTHGAQSKPRIAERGAEIAEQLLAAGHLDVNLDSLACQEVGRLCAVIEACDQSIESRGVVTGSGAARNIVGIRLSASRALESWLRELGQTPKARAEVVAALRSSTAPSFSDSYTRRLAELRSGANGDGDA